MPILVQWDDSEKTRFLWLFQGAWDAKDYAAGMDRSNTLALEVEHPIDVIVDLTGSRLFPSHMLSNLRASRATQPHKMGRIVVVGSGLFVAGMIDTIGKIYKAIGAKITTAGSLEEARQWLDSAKGRAQQSGETSAAGVGPAGSE